MNIPRNYVTHGVVAVVSLAVGGGVSFLVTKHILETKFDEILEDELAKAKEHYKRTYKAEEYSDAVKAAEEALELLNSDETPTEDRNRTYDTTSKEMPEKPTLGETVEKIKQSIEANRNVFRNVDEMPEIEDEDRDARDPTKPYIVSLNEYRDNPKEHEQITLTYFEADDVLADSGDVVIEDSDKVVGDDNLTKFGYGSGDNNVLLVRNEPMEIDFEILRSNGSYAREVLGFIEHDDVHEDRHRRFRGDDE